MLKRGQPPKGADKENKTATVAQYVAGQPVELVPSQGCYQKSRTAKVVSVSEKQVVVRADDKQSLIRFNRETGKPVRKIDQDFPCYVLKVI